ncbi:MAG: hypothetical protein IPM29_29475 [Planctomycetes bacterium]|nr:hypothetical protein [Planctomycetota bacterium]
MEVSEAIERILLGESLAQVVAAWREEALAALGLRLDEARPETFRPEAIRFANKVCRTLGERHEGDSRAETALAVWARQVDEYDVYDALLSHFRSFDGRDALVRRGRQLFPGPLTSHWDDTW